jgi:hypothetical protein
MGFCFGYDIFVSPKAHPLEQIFEVGKEIIVTGGLSWKVWWLQNETELQFVQICLPSTFDSRHSLDKKALFFSPFEAFFFLTSSFNRNNRVI